MTLREKWVATCDGHDCTETIVLDHRLGDVIWSGIQRVREAGWQIDTYPPRMTRCPKHTPEVAE